MLPALLLNYFGQGAYILEHPVDAVHPFYNLVPSWGVYPMIGLATTVTVIASQAVISGTFSLMRQAIQLRQSPPLTIVQTSSEEIGQIYVPLMNWVLLVGTIALVIGFQTSSALAAAYGVAVSATMVITTVLGFFVMRERWKWSLGTSLLVCALFASADLTFFSANLSKVAEGGWFPLAVATLALLLMNTWAGGRDLFQQRTAARTMEIRFFLESLAVEPPPRVAGTAVFMTAPGDNVPSGLLHHLKLNKMLHERVILLTAVTEDVPRVPAAQRLRVISMKNGFFRVYVHYGFMQSPNIPVAIKLCRDQYLIPDLDVDMVAYFVDRATLIPTPEKAGMRLWRKHLYAFMVRNSQLAVEFYNLPPGKTVELGLQVEL